MTKSGRVVTFPNRNAVSALRIVNLARHYSLDSEGTLLNDK
jgi:hypothetical protein